MEKSLATGCVSCGILHCNFDSVSLEVSFSNSYAWNNTYLRLWESSEMTEEVETAEVIGTYPSIAQ